MRLPGVIRVFGIQLVTGYDVTLGIRPRDGGLDGFVDNRSAGPGHINFYGPLGGVAAVFQAGGHRQPRG